MREGRGRRCVEGGEREEVWGGRREGGGVWREERGRRCVEGGERGSEEGGRSWNRRGGVREERVGGVVSYSEW